MMTGNQKRDTDTIYALSSGGLPSGVAVIRVSGGKAAEVVRLLSGSDVAHRKFEYCVLRSLDGSSILDRGLVVFFEGPDSFTGEDTAEFHLHGGKAVVSRFLLELSAIEGLRMAEAGEFSRRAFENDKMDLTEAEGLADLIASETEVQRKLAVRQSGGGLRNRLESWRSDLIRARAFVEVEFDFSDEEDVPDSMLDEVKHLVAKLQAEIRSVLKSSNAGEIIRNGFRIALMGAPNSGKSSLLNALAQREVAIVSDRPGTTRDVLEVSLDIDGVPVVLSDTAGLRETTDEIELEGIERARKAGEGSDLVFWLIPINVNGEIDEVRPENSVIINTKSDLEPGSTKEGVKISVKSEGGLEALLDLIRGRLDASGAFDGDMLINRERHRLEILKVVSDLELFQSECGKDVTLAAEYLRTASDAIGRLTGRVDVEDLLDVVFSEFCIGK